MYLIKHRKISVIFGIILIFSAIAISLFRHSEMSAESYGYWFFARIFDETGKFLVIDRSSLYTLYLNAFLWMGYPYSIITEFIFTSLILVISLIILFKRFFGFLPAVFAAIVWLPYLQTAAPPVQMLALACSCLGVVARLDDKSLVKAMSYSFLILAYLFRPTYLVMIVCFLLWDIFKLLQNYDLKKIMNSFMDKYKFLPLIIVIGLFIWFISAQSNHQFNNAYMTSTMWFPANEKSLRDAAFIQDYNWEYIAVKYGTFENKDFYHTNRELFGGSRTAFRAILNNPNFVIKQIGSNIKDTVLVTSSLTIMGSIRNLIGGNAFTGFYSILIVIIGSFAGIAVLYGAFRVSKNESINIFIISNLLIIVIVTVFIPKPRYFPPMVIVLTFSAYWYSSKINKILSKFSSKSGKVAVPLIILLIFSNGVEGWARTFDNFITDVGNKDIKILENEANSIKSNFAQINSLVKECDGVLSREALFIGAFMEIPIDKVYDIWEIPPFGSLGNPIYDGLRPDRVDCLIVSDILATEIGKGTNMQMRFDNYINPYAEYLKKNGAGIHYFERFGYMLILPKSRSNQVVAQ